MLAHALGFLFVYLSATLRTAAAGNLSCACPRNSQLGATVPTWEHVYPQDDAVVQLLPERYIFNTDHSVQVACVLTKPSSGYLLFRCVGSNTSTGDVEWEMTPDGSKENPVKFHYTGQEYVGSTPRRYVDPQTPQRYDPTMLMFRQARLESTGQFGLLPLFFGASSTTFSYDGVETDYSQSKHYFFEHVQVFDMTTGAKVMLATIPSEGEKVRLFRETVCDVLWTHAEHPSIAYVYSGVELYLMTINASAQVPVVFSSLSLRGESQRVSYVAVSRNLSTALYVKDGIFFCARIHLDTANVTGSFQEETSSVPGRILNVAFEPNEVFALVQYENRISKILLESCTNTFHVQKISPGMNFEPSLMSVLDLDPLLLEVYSKVLITPTFIFVPYWTDQKAACFLRYTHDFGTNKTECFQGRNAISFAEEQTVNNTEGVVYAAQRAVPQPGFTFLVFSEHSLDKVLNYTETTSFVDTLGVSIRTQALFLRYDSGVAVRWPTTCIDTLCTECGPGAVQSLQWLNSSTVCQNCPLGKYRGDRDDCQNCPQGKYRGDGDDSCNPCRRGSYAALSASSTCTLCPQDTFSNESGATACTECAAAQYAPGPGDTDCLVCALVRKDHSDALQPTPRPSQRVTLFGGGDSAPASAPRMKISPNQRCLALLLEDLEIQDGRAQARVLVLGAQSGARSEELTLEGMGTFLDFAVTDTALYAVFAHANVSVAKVPLDPYCRVGAAAALQHSTGNLTACNGTSIAFAGAGGAYVLLCGGENTSTVAGALALETGALKSWPGASAGAPRLVQWLASDDTIISFAVHSVDTGPPRLLTQNVSGAFEELRELDAHDDEDWVLLAGIGEAGSELLFLPGTYPRVAELYANGSVRAWQLRGCFEYEVAGEAAYAQTNAHAVLFGRANCNDGHKLVDSNGGCLDKNGTEAGNTTEYYIHGDLGYVPVPSCDMRRRAFPKFEQTRIFNNHSPLRELCTQSLGCKYGSEAAPGSTDCLCRAGFYRPHASADCQACEVGNFSNATESSGCTPCPDGTPFSHRASTGARSCFAAYGIDEADAGVLDELRGLAKIEQVTEDVVFLHAEAEQEQKANMSELRALLGP